MYKGVSFIVEGIMFEICDFGKWWNFDCGGKQVLKEECKNMEASGEAGFHHCLLHGQSAILQDPCPAHFTKTQAYFLYNSCDKSASMHLVWSLKFIIFLIELNLLFPDQHRSQGLSKYFCLGDVAILIIWRAFSLWLIKTH